MDFIYKKETKMGDIEASNSVIKRVSTKKKQKDKNKLMPNR